MTDICLRGGRVIDPGRSFDAHYAVSLSDDGVPTLMKSLPALSAADQRIIAAKVLERLSPTKETDSRTWNWSPIRRRRRASTCSRTRRRSG